MKHYKLIFSEAKLHILITLLCIFLLPEAMLAAVWQPDILGNGYQMRSVEQGEDYSGPVVSTLVRRLVSDTLPCGTPRKAMLYIHGFNDYFFNPEIGEEANSHGYDFYAVDLRKYGRSLLKAQRPFEARSLREYFPDIDSALVEIRHAGNAYTVVMGHSTGGLIAALYCSENPSAPVDALILNSPFLDWNLGKLEYAIPLIDVLGAIFPNFEIEQGKSSSYAESLLKKYHGEWQYDTRWKMEQSPDVTAGWVRAISKAQKRLRDGKAHINIPILLMYSARSIHSPEWIPQSNSADGVLDVSDIRHYGMELGSRVTPLKVSGGVHDLLLSRGPLRRALYTRIFLWLDQMLY